jgi:hypothetical protein
MDKELDEMIRLIYQAVVGIPDNPDERGLIGDVREIKDHLKKLNGETIKNTTFRKIGTWVSCAIATAVVGLLVKVIFGG